jgi:hypothetical protein
MMAGNIQALMPVELDVRYIHQFVEVMQSYRSQMEMVIAELDASGKKRNGARNSRSPGRQVDN